MQRDVTFWRKKTDANNKASRFARRLKKRVTVIAGPFHYIKAPTENGIEIGGRLKKFHFSSTSFVISDALCLHRRGLRTRNRSVYL